MPAMASYARLAFSEGRNHRGCPPSGGGSSSTFRIAGVQTGAYALTEVLDLLCASTDPT
jgi:hypothetical protein